MRTKNRNILVVDDEPNIVAVVRSYLEKAGYTVEEADNGQAALQQVDRVQPCLVILDLMLPDISGEAVCQEIRKKSPVPIIMLTAKVAEESVLNGLGLGADDYVTKPFSPRQLVARVEALLRRAENFVTPLANLLSYNDDLEIDGVKHEVRKAGQTVNLTPNEFSILITLAKYPNKVFTRDELITAALGEDFDGYERTIDTHIKNLRQKIETDPRNPCYLLTVHGVGYRFGGEH
ncbi:MAG TPA: response regulator transcription factor [Bacillota bacterium]|nr:response regulator transcription factor [Bacillota bacterium]